MILGDDTILFGMCDECDHRCDCSFFKKGGFCDEVTE
jgi:hypothetical protein